MKRQGKLSNKLSLMVAITLILAIAICTSISVWITKKSLYDEMETLGLQIGQLALDRMEGSNMNLDETQSLCEEIGSNKSMVYATVLDPSFKAIAHSDSTRIGMEFKDSGTEKAMSGEAFTTIYFSKDRGINVYDVVLPIKDDTKQVVGVLNVGLTVKPVDEAIGGIIISMGVIGIVLAVVAAVAMYFILRLTLKPLVKLKDATVAISNFDLTQEVVYNGNNEIGEMAEAFNRMQTNLRETIGTLATNAHGLNSSSTNLAATSQNSSSEMQEITASTEEISASLEEISAFSEEIASSGEEMTEAMKSLMNDLDAGRKQSVEIGVKATKVNKQTVDAKERTRLLYEKIDLEIKEAIEESQVVKEIGNMADSISSISEQINLLALNAAIEAARAGEQGKGFAVVAEEVRKLAGESAQTVKNIIEMTGKVQGATSDLVSSTDKVLHFISKDVFEDYNLLIETSNQYAQDAENYNKMLSQFSNLGTSVLHSVEEVGHQIESMASTIEQISESASNVADGAGTVGASVISLATEANDLNKIAADLDVIAKQYKF